MVSDRRISFAVASSLFVITVAAFLRPPLLPEIGRDLNLSSLGLGAMGSVFALGRLAADLPAGRMSDRMAAPRMMIGAALMVAIGSGLLAASPTSVAAFVAVFVLGAGSAWTLTTAQAHFANAPRARRGAAMSIFAGALLTAQAIAPAIGGAVGALAGWRVAIAIGAALSFGVIGPLYLLRRTPPPVAVATTEEPLDADDRDTGLVLTFIYLLPAVQFAIGAAMIQTLVPLVADEQLGMGVGLVGTLLGIGGVARLIGAVAAGRVMDRIGRRAALIPGLAFQLAGVVIFASWGSVLALWISVMLVSLGSVSVNVGTTLLADLSEGGRLGPRLGAFRFTGDGAFLIAPVLAGWLLGTQGRSAAMLPLVVLTAIVLFGCMLWVPETHGRSRAREAA